MTPGNKRRLKIGLAVFFGLLALAGVIVGILIGTKVIDVSAIGRSDRTDRSVNEPGSSEEPSSFEPTTPAPTTPVPTTPAPTTPAPTTPEPTTPAPTTPAPTTPAPTTPAPTTPAPTTPAPTTPAPTMPSQQAKFYMGLGSIGQHGIISGPEGNLGSRSTTSGICSTKANELGLSCSKVVSFLSYTGDSIKDMPTNHGFDPNIPLKGPNGQTFATSWDNAMNSNFNRETVYPYPQAPSYSEERTIFPSTAGFPDYYWTGSTSTGDASHNCNNWTSTSKFTKSEFGDSGGGWLKFSLTPNPTSCEYENRAMMCVCIQDYES